MKRKNFNVRNVKAVRLNNKLLPFKPLPPARVNPNVE
jgi:hypothetical protein